MTRRTLSWFNVALGLASLHYGMGFLLGIAESSYSRGAQGTLYGVSCAVGVLALFVVSRFYWAKKVPLWTILGRAYGRRVEGLVCFLSWVWMIGVVASQVLGGAFVLGTLGIPPLLSIWILSVAVNIFSLWKLNKLSKVFLTTLLVSSAAMLLVVLYFSGVGLYTDMVSEFVQIAPGIQRMDLFGIGLTTVLITVLGMDFHQFVVRSKSVGQAYVGELVAFAVLLLLAFLPVAIVGLGKYDDLMFLDAKQALPRILLLRGNMLFEGLGDVFVGSLAFAALGSGIGVARVVNRTARKFSFLPREGTGDVAIVVFGIFTVGFLATFGSSIISLIVSFYSIYLAGLVVPFVAYVLEKRGFWRFSPGQIYLSMLLGSSTALLIVVIKHFSVYVSPMSTEFLAITVGVLGSLFGLLMMEIPRTPALARRDP